MSNIKKIVNLLCLFLSFNILCVNFGQFMLPISFRSSFVEHYNKKYQTSIINPNHGSLNVFLESQDFWYVFKRSDCCKQNDNVRLMWFIGIEAGHSIPVFYIQENGKKAILIADSLGLANYSLPHIAQSAMYRELDIPIFIIQDRRQNDSYSCYLDALVWGKMVTGKLLDGAYRIPNLLEFLFQHSEKISIDSSNPIAGQNHQLYSAKKLPTTLLATTQSLEFMAKYRIEDDDTYITSKGLVESFDGFLNNHKKVFAFDYLRSKGVFIYYHFYKYLPLKDSVRCGLNIVLEQASFKVNLTRFDLGRFSSLAFCAGYMACDIEHSGLFSNMYSRIAKIFSYQ